MLVATCSLKEINMRHKLTHTHTLILTQADQKAFMAHKHMLKKSKQISIQGSLYHVCGYSSNTTDYEQDPVTVIQRSVNPSDSRQTQAHGWNQMQLQQSQSETITTQPSWSARAEHSLSQEIPHHAPYLLGSSGYRRERVKGSSATGTRGRARGRGRGAGVEDVEGGGDDTTERLKGGFKI